jgi:1,4-alpha-glucan branching enzyme
VTTPHPLAAELDRIAAVLHTEPHAVLGAHEDAGGLVVRAFRPDAEGITVLPDGAAPVPMTRVHDAGVFEAHLPGARFPFGYRLEIRYATATFTQRDPYAFWPTLGDLDVLLAAQGTHRELYRRMGAHVREIDGVRGTSFTVWAPSAQRVSVTGDFNTWDGRLHAMRRMGSGIWEIFVPDVGEGALYKFEIITPEGLPILKCDPYGRAMELRPQTASRVVESRHEWTDAAWIEARASHDPKRRPLAIYEVHLGSWRRAPRAPGDTRPPENEGPRWLDYRELADSLVDYVADLGFTHVELLPIMEHPFDGSWGYQVSGYFAPTSRYGSPDDFRYFVDRCHSRGLGVILDWTPAHFPKDSFALGRFDGTALYEHLDPRLGEHKEWSTYIFNYGRNEVKNFLLANALYWLDELHVDGLRVDAVASMLHLDYGAKHPGEWIPNKYGGRENLEAVAFVRELCDVVHERFPGAMVIAEESTAWPGVTRPTYVGGLGFDFKWNMGWMHDTLDYFKQDPVYRAFHHDKLTFGIWYAYSEEFALPLSLDEVVHLKKSLLSKMPGDRWQMHANLRALYAYMWGHPGKKLLFMGGELGQWREWSEERELDWHLLGEPDHAGVWKLVRDLNRLYREHPAMWQLDGHPMGFSWIDPNDKSQSVASFIRYPIDPTLVGERAAAGGAAAAGAPPAAKEPRLDRHAKHGTHVVVVGNFTPVPRVGYRLGVPRDCRYRELLNTDAREYGGSGMGNLGVCAVEPVPCHGHAQSITLTLPPLSVLWLVPERDEAEEGERER